MKALVWHGKENVQVNDARIPDITQDVSRTFRFWDGEADATGSEGRRGAQGDGNHHLW